MRSGARGPAAPRPWPRGNKKGMTGSVTQTPCPALGSPRVTAEDRKDLETQASREGRVRSSGRETASVLRGLCPACDCCLADGPQTRPRGPLFGLFPPTHGFFPVTLLLLPLCFCFSLLFCAPVCVCVCDPEGRGSLCVAGSDQYRELFWGLGHCWSPQLWLEGQDPRI